MAKTSAKKTKSSAKKGATKTKRVEAGALRRAAAAVQPAISPALMKRYEGLLREMRASRRDEARGWDAYWETVGTILDERLYLLSPEGTAEGWCAAQTGESYRTCLRNARIARYCSPTDEATYTAEKLEAALQWIEAKLGGLPPRGGLKVKLDELRVPIARDGKTMELGLADATAKEILSALRGRPAGAKAKPSPVERAFEKAMRGEKPLQDTRVRVHDGRVTIVGVPLSHWTAFLRVARTVDWKSALPD